MKNNVLLLLSVIGLLTFSACMQDQPNESDVRKEVKVSASFKNSASDAKVTTRATGNTWQVGDAIGLFMKKSDRALTQSALADNAKYITTGTSSFSPAAEDFKIYYLFDKTKVDFISYHPYTVFLNDLKYEIDVSDQNDISAIDLLYSNNVKDKSSNDETINLTFEHQLTKVTLKIATNYTGKEQAGLTAKITNVNTKASFSLVDGLIYDPIEPKEVLFNVNAEGTLAEAIVLPDNDLSNKKFVIKIGETNYTYNLSSSVIKSFEKSKLCEYTITIEPTYGPSIKGVTATVTDWTTVAENISVIEEPPFITPPDEEDDPVTPPPGAGNGTKDNPYTITQALQKVAVETNVWIKGYIVGGYIGMTKGSFVNSAKGGSRSRMALAFSIEEINPEMTFTVDLNKGHSNIINGVNTHEKPEHFKKEIIFNATIGFYNPGQNIFGIIVLKKAIINGKEYSE